MGKPRTKKTPVPQTIYVAPVAEQTVFQRYSTQVVFAVALIAAAVLVLLAYYRFSQNQALRLPTNDVVIDHVDDTTASESALPSASPTMAPKKASAVKQDVPNRPLTMSTPPQTSQRYVVRRGDSLSLIAQRVYGNARLWPTLYRANRVQIGQNPSLIFSGTSLLLPKIASRVSR